MQHLFHGNPREALSHVAKVKVSKTVLIEEFFRTQVIPFADIDERFPDFVRYDCFQDLKAAKVEYDEHLKETQDEGSTFRICGWSLFKTYVVNLLASSHLQCLLCRIWKSVVWTFLSLSRLCKIRPETQITE
jgi:hypothetical protein